jgi:hypothetical protein
MIRDYTKTEDGAEGVVFVERFGSEADLLVNGQVPRDRVEVVCGVINSLPESQLIELCKATASYRANLTRRATPRFGLFGRKKSKGDTTTGLASTDFQNAEAILRDINLVSVTIWEPQENVDGFNLEFSCNWNEDDGVEWCFRGNEAVYVGPAAGVYPWDDLSSDPTNSL